MYLQEQDLGWESESSPWFFYELFKTKYLTFQTLNYTPITELKIKISFQKLASRFFQKLNGKVKTIDFIQIKPKNEI